MSSNEVFRPLIVTIIGGYFFFIGLTMLVVTVLMRLNPGFIYFESGDFGLIEIVYAVVQLVMGYGMLKGWTVMWYIGAIVLIFSLVALLLLFIIAVVEELSVYAIVLIGIYASLEALVLCHMYRLNVKSFFGV